MARVSPRMLLPLVLVAMPACTNCATSVSDDDGGASGGPNGTSSGDGGFIRGDGGASTSSGAASSSSGATSSSSGSSGSGCGSREICDDGLDNNCNGTVDEGCDCVGGTTQACYVGDPARAGVGACVRGTMTCTVAGESGIWGACTGSVAPAAVQCGSGIDYACVGNPDQGCACQINASRACYTGAAGTQDVGLCRGGHQTCVVGASGAEWGPCNDVPPAAETCDGRDHNCNGTVDDGCTCTIGQGRDCYTGPAGTSGVGLCHAGHQTCVQGAAGPEWNACTGEVTPAAETCDGRDHNCNGQNDDGCGCTVGQTRACYSGPPATQNVGLCHGGTQSCVAGADGGPSSFGACTNEVVPHPDQCNGTDTDCDGNLNTGCACQVGAQLDCYDGPAGTAGVGPCHGGKKTCAALPAGGTGYGACANQVVPATEVCADAIDNNCDGTVNNGCAAMACSADVTIDAGTTTTVTASGAGLTGFSWSIVTQPSAAGSSAEWTPTPPNAASVAFKPYIVGVYTLQATATDAHGATQTCRVNVTARAHGLRIELVWNGTGDVDLHLLDGAATHWFQMDGANPANNHDCFYSDCIPGGPYSVHGPTPWGASLDVDNVTANGPENINVNNPVVGEEYFIGVHNYARAAGRIATVNVFCGLTSGVTPTRTFTSRALVGSGTGGTTDGTNELWRMATVTFTSPGACTINYVNTYLSASAANSVR